jgi:DNA-binding CsgD family transcriptional regulator
LHVFDHRSIDADQAADQPAAGQMGERLGISTKTVRNHLSAPYLKPGVTDRTQAAITRELTEGAA